MRILIGFDDTDTLAADRGTGKLARWFEKELPSSCRLWGVVRQQLLVHADVPYTSHNSSACVVVEMADDCRIEELAEKAIAHIERLAFEGSDPGLCVARVGDPALPRLIDFGRKCTHRVTSQQEARDAARDVHLSGHGGTNDGIIGAAAAVGLTAYGWCGRFIEFGGLRSYPELVSVSDLEHSDIMVVSLDRDAAFQPPRTSFTTGAGCGRGFGVAEPCWGLPPMVTAAGKRRIGKRGRDTASRAGGILRPVLET